jgi:glycosyltransferase involved in cell wall biosynthesis
MTVEYEEEAVFVETQTQPRCAIVVPCYNEASRLQSDRFLDFLQSHEDIHFLFVNDGSRDDTLAVLKAMQIGCEDRIQILDMIQNGGKAEAVRAGMLAAIQRGDVSYVGFWDADLATPLEAIPEFLDVIEGSDELEMVFGSRIRLLGRHVNRRAARHYLGRVFASVVSIVLRLPIYDTQCGAKVFRITPELSQVLQDPFLSRWVFDVEILARYIALHDGSSAFLHEAIYELPLARWDDVAGSKVGAGDFLIAFLDILRIYRKYLLHHRRGANGSLNKS